MKERLTAFVQNKGITYRVLRDQTGEVFKRYLVLGTPTLVVIDKDQKTYYRGHVLEQAIHKLMDCALKNAPRRESS